MDSFNTNINLLDTSVASEITKLVLLAELFLASVSQTTFEFYESVFGNLGSICLAKFAEHVD